jgi:sialate O-acetylesterase
MKGWRRQFGDPELALLIVGLAGFGQPKTAPGPSSWAALIDEQRKAADADPRAELVSAIDIGERDDIHPPNKQEVGRRLALAVEALAYGDSKGAVTARVVAAERSGGDIMVRFNRPMQSYGGPPMAFELCAGEQASCRYVAARVDGSNLVLAGDGKPATRVRYAWADYPIVNLYGPEKLPVPPFEIVIARSESDEAIQR